MNDHRIHLIRYRDETIECTCGAIITARVDELFRDRHLPLTERWAAHRKAAGLTTPHFTNSASRKVPA